MRDKFLLVNYLFIISLIVLFLNDHIFKTNFSNWFTGKISDVFGIILLPFLITYLFPKLKQNSVFVTIAFFIFWKSPFSNSFITLYNSISPIAITRIVDYTDFLSFAFLPISYYIIKNFERFNFLKLHRINTSFLLIPTVLVLMSTSPPKYYHYDPQTGNISFAEFNIVVEGRNREYVINEFQKRNITIHKDTVRIINSEKYKLLNINLEQQNLQSKSVIFKVNQDSLKQAIFKEIDKSDYYIINSIKLEEEIVNDVKFIMYEYNDKNKVISTGLRIQNLKSSKDLTENKIQRKLKKIYREAIKSEFLIK